MDHSFKSTCQTLLVSASFQMSLSQSRQFMRVHVLAVPGVNIVNKQQQ